VISGTDRRGLLTGFRHFFGGSVSPGASTGRRGPVLTDRQAEALFDRYCRLRFAGSFKLYKIYGRAAAFSG
jgi:hypothetical protein